MTYPQFMMATILLVNLVTILVIWHRYRDHPAVLLAPKPWQRVVLRHSWVIAVAPLTEAYILWLGGFWG